MDQFASTIPFIEIDGQKVDSEARSNCIVREWNCQKGTFERLMLNGLYSSATALNINMHNQDLISHNLAHVNVPGYKRSMQTVATFDDMVERVNANGESQFENANSSPVSKNINGAHFAAFKTDFSQGRIEETGDNLNVALDGDGFFVIQGENGPLYTRNGDFKVNANKQLVLPSGFIVEGEGGPIEISNALGASIAQDGTITVDGEEAGKLRVVNFTDLNQLLPAGTTLFYAPENAAPEEADLGKTRIIGGCLESSNTQAVDELIKMIAGMRHFEAAQKTLTSISETIAKHTSTQTA